MSTENRNGFHFGLEAKSLLVDSASFRPNGIAKRGWPIASMRPALPIIMWDGAAPLKSAPEQRRRGSEATQKSFGSRCVARPFDGSKAVRHSWAPNGAAAVRWGPGQMQPGQMPMQRPPAGNR